MFDFKPSEDAATSVPFFDDVTAAQGWEGHTTSKTIEQLQSEISANMSRLGCMVTGIISGSYGDRQGFQIHFAIRLPQGGLAPSRFDIACLPINPKKRVRQRYNRPVHGDPRIEGTRKMGLYMVNKALKGMWFLSVLAPGFVPFMSLMLDRKNQTLGSVWIQSGKLAALMPPKEKFEEEDVIDGETS